MNVQAAPPEIEEQREHRRREEMRMSFVAPPSVRRVSGIFSMVDKRASTGDSDAQLLAEFDRIALEVEASAIEQSTKLPSILMPTLEEDAKENPEERPQTAGKFGFSHTYVIALSYCVFL